MKEVSKFIPMDGTGDVTVGNNTGAEMGNGGAGIENSTFRVCNANETKTNLPAKPSFWSKLKGVLTYEIKVELTPYQQKIEDEINAFLHQDVTWKSFKDFLFQEVTIK